jgi:hypothetical protein
MTKKKEISREIKMRPPTKKETENLFKATGVYNKPTKEQVDNKQIDELQKQVCKLESRIKELESNKNVITVKVEQDNGYPWLYYYPKESKVYKCPKPKESPWPYQIWCDQAGVSSDNIQFATGVDKNED